MCGSCNGRDARCPSWRLGGGTLTQEFLAGLPDGWTKSKLALVEGAFRGVDAEEMAKHDLRREIKREWSQAA